MFVAVLEAALGLLLAVLFDPSVKSLKSSSSSAKET